MTWIVISFRKSAGPSPLHVTTADNGSHRQYATTHHPTHTSSSIYLCACRCSHAGCGSGYLLDDLPRFNIMTCRSCRRRTCAHHRTIYHDGLTCKQVGLTSKLPPYWVYGLSQSAAAVIRLPHPCSCSLRSTTTSWLRHHTMTSPRCGSRRTPSHAPSVLRRCRFLGGFKGSPTLPILV